MQISFEVFELHKERERDFLFLNYGLKVQVNMQIRYGSLNSINFWIVKYVDVTVVILKVSIDLRIHIRNVLPYAWQLKIK